MIRLLIACALGLGLLSAASAGAPALAIALRPDLPGVVLVAWMPPPAQTLACASVNGVDQTCVVSTTAGAHVAAAPYDLVCVRAESRAALLAAGCAVVVPDAAVVYPTYPASGERRGDAVSVAIRSPPGAARWCAVASDPGGVVCRNAQPVIIAAVPGADMHIYLFDSALTYLGSGQATAPPYAVYLPGVSR